MSQSKHIPRTPDKFHPKAHCNKRIALQTMEISGTMPIMMTQRYDFARDTALHIKRDSEK